MNWVDVLIIVDNKARDGLAAHILAERLKREGISSLFTNKLKALRMAELFRPRVAIFPHFFGWGDQFARQMKKQGIKIVMVPTEGAIPEEDRGGIGVYKGSDIRLADRILMWGPKTRDLVIRAGLAEPERLKVTSTVRFEHFWPNLKKDPIQTGSLFDPSRQPAPRTVGVPISGINLNLYHQSNTIVHINQMRKTPENRGFDRKRGQDVEDNYWFQVSILRHLLDILDLFQEKGANVRLRPGIFENYKAYEGLYPKSFLEVDAGEPLPFWLAKNQVIVSGQSTVGVESIILGKPVLYYFDIIGKRLFEHIDLPVYTTAPFARFFWRPKTKEELLEMAELAFAGKLDPTPNTDEFRKYVQDYYDFPRKEEPSRSIVREIREVLQS